MQYVYQTDRQAYNLSLKQKWTRRQRIFWIKRWADSGQSGFKPIKKRSTRGFFFPLIFSWNSVLMSRGPPRVFQLTRNYYEGRWCRCDPTRRIYSELSCCMSDSVGWDVKMSGDAASPVCESVMWDDGGEASQAKRGARSPVSSPKYRVNVKDVPFIVVHFGAFT